MKKHIPLIIVLSVYTGFFCFYQIKFFCDGIYLLNHPYASSFGASGAFEVCILISIVAIPCLLAFIFEIIRLIKDAIKEKTMSVKTMAIMLILSIIVFASFFVESLTLLITNGFDMTVLLICLLVLVAGLIPLGLVIYLALIKKKATL